MGPAIQKASGNPNTKAAADLITQEYIKKTFGINQNTYEEMGTMDLLAKCKESLLSCTLQLNAVNDVGQDAR